MNNTTEFYLNTITGDLKCPSDYISIILGMILIVSEGLGLYQKSDCNNKEIIDESGEVVKEDKSNFLHNVNGILHLFLKVVKKKK